MEFVIKQMACGLDLVSATTCPKACKAYLPKLAAAFPECAIAVDLLCSSASYNKLEDNMLKLCTGV